MDLQIIWEEKEELVVEKSSSVPMSRSGCQTALRVMYQRKVADDDGLLRQDRAQETSQRSDCTFKP